MSAIGYMYPSLSCIHMLDIEIGIQIGADYLYHAT